ncbi:nitroreductase family protein, partial [Streptomyces shenzhenensis]|uniref:nitroreductase family protein n=1 Tax=Streptomyces shenzhenensis TaxID=943815 RepID=UPI0033C0AC09
MTRGLCDGLSLITSRHCKRAFLDRAVPRDALAEILLAAGHAPSSRNTQMWQVTVVTGGALKTLVDALCEAFDRGDPPRPDSKSTFIFHGENQIASPASSAARLA